MTCVFTLLFALANFQYEYRAVTGTGTSYQSAVMTRNNVGYTLRSLPL